MITLARSFAVNGVKVFLPRIPHLIDLKLSEDIFNRESLLTVLKFARIVKENSPNLKIVTGGIHPTYFPKEILTNCHD